MDNIDELLTRGVANIIPSKEDLKKLIESGKKLNIYLGIDPTATKIHLGHAVPLRFLQKFTDMGHNVTFLIGDFTALVGDTSDKDTERPVLTKEEIEENFATYKEQASKILDFSKIKVVHNSDWLSKLTYVDILKLKQKFTLNDFISRELIKKRLSEGKSIRLDETEYPIMQGYDSYIMDTDLQIGATDQTFNMQAGRHLQKVIRNKDTFILATEYLTGTDGRKMSKSWGNAIWLTDTPTDMFGKIMSINDDLIVEYFTLATDIPMDEIKKMENDISLGKNPMEFKKRLARTIVSMLHGDQESEKADLDFQKVVQEKQLPDEVEEIEIRTDSPLSKILIEKNLVDSMGEWKRLIEQHGVSIDDLKIDNPFIITKDIKNGAILKIGKRKYAKIMKVS